MITSAEVGVLWMTYMMRTLLKQVSFNFAQKSTDQKAKDLLNYYLVNTEPTITGLRQIFEKEKAVVPKGFDGKDVFNDAPALFDDAFHIMFFRILAKGMMGFDSVHLSFSYRQDIRDYFLKAWLFSKDIYNQCTDYLTEQGVLARAPYITMPKEAEFIEDKKYMSGFTMMRSKRTLNMVEIAYLYQIIEVNILGMQLMAGFAQVAKEQEVRDYFMRGKELSKKIVSDISSLMLDSDIHAPATWAGKATDSSVAPFTDKLMLYLVNILTSSATAGNAMLGMVYSMRNDLPAKLAIIAANTAKFAKDGGKLMITHRWLEEPPQMEDRNQLIKSK
jgi:hypothetical protein